MNFWGKVDFGEVNITLILFTLPLFAKNHPCKKVARTNRNATVSNQIFCHHFKQNCSKYPLYFSPLIFTLKSAILGKPPENQKQPEPVAVSF